MKKNVQTSVTSTLANPNECFKNGAQFHSVGDEKKAIFYFTKAMEVRNSRFLIINIAPIYLILSICPLTL